MPQMMDLLLLAVFGLLTFMGWKRGFIRTVLSLGRMILAVLLTSILGPAVSEWLNRTFVYPTVYEGIHARFAAIAAEVTATAQGSVDALIQKIPAVFRGYLNPEQIDPASDIHRLAEDLSRTVAGNISKVIATVAGYVLLFVISFVLLTLAIFLVGQLVDHIRFVRTADKLLGMLLGSISGSIAVLLLSAVLGAILTVMGRESVVESSFMLRLSAGVRETIFK